MYDLVVVGAGASGVLASIRAAMNNKKVLLLEKKDRILKKILITGNGQCNFTNINATSKNYHSVENETLAKEYIEKLFSKYDPKYIMEFFENLGIMNFIKKNGKVYPMSLQANSINDCLRNAMLKYSVDTLVNSDCYDILKEKDIFKVRYIIEGEKKEVYTKNVLISTGGITSFDVNESNSVYFATNKNISHTRTNLYPVLVQLKTDKKYIKGLEGIKLVSKVSFKYKGKILDENTEEFLFTSYGISGPSIFNLSYLLGKYPCSDIVVIVDFMPEIFSDKLKDILLKRINNLSHLNLEDFFTGMLNKKLGQFLLKNIGFEKLNVSVDNIYDKIDDLVKILKYYEIRIEDTMGFKNAQVTAGGIRLTEINDDFSSKKIKGMYLTGEVLDLYGECGGYNLQYCFASGISVGDSI